MRTRGMLLFCAAAVFGAVFATTETASALFARRHAVACWWDNLQSGNSPFIFGGSVAVTNNNAGRATLICPAVDDSALPKSQQVTLRVHGFDGNAGTNASFRACVTFATVAGGECEVTASSTATGNYSLLVSTTRWQLHPSHYGYLTAGIPAKDPATQTASLFRGYEGSNP